MTFWDDLKQLTGYSSATGTRAAAFWLGLVAVIHCLFVFMSNKRDRIFIQKVISDVLWGLQYLLFGILTSALIYLFAIGRDVVFYFRGKRAWADRRLWMWVFIVLMMLSPLADFISGGFSLYLLLPAAGSALTVVSFYGQNTLVTKILMVISCCMYLVFTVKIGNFMSFLGTSATLISSVVGLLHEWIALRQKKRGAPENTN
ncbi:MAG: YgjV family protein [Clostridia bacterium]|nr:YgjV family protein [Clostridia bacterium]